jgi:uncharacterized DUF497 family protein
MLYFPQKTTFDNYYKKALHYKHGEERRQTLGKVGPIFFVVYTEEGDAKRIITARPAEKGERRSYEGYYRIDGKGWEESAP